MTRLAMQWHVVRGPDGRKHLDLAWEAAHRAPCTTIQLNTHFLAAVQPGDFVELRGEVTRATTGLVFVRGILVAGDRDVAAVDGIWRVLRTA